MSTPLSGLTWASNTITWAFAAPGAVPNLGTVTSTISDPAQQTAVAVGINDWAKISGVNLVQITDPSQAAVQVGYGNPAGLLGEALWYYNPQTSHYNSALVLLKDPSVASLTTTSTGNIIYSGLVTTLQQLATHEFGAAIGLAEGNGSDPNSVMNHVQGLSNQVPDAADINAVDSLYGPPASNPPPPPPSSNQDVLTLRVSEDAWQGDAQFVIKLDGKQIGGTETASALYPAGDTNVFLLKGAWGQGSHTVQIQFVNDSWGGTPTTDRNLHVGSIAYDGVTYSGTTAAMNSNGTDSFVIGGSTQATSGPADTLTLHLSEDAWKGDALFTLTIDGKQISTPQAVVASHSTGAWEDLSFAGNLGAGSHRVGIIFTNDAYGGSQATDRNLYINGIDLNGQHYGSESTALMSNGTASFTATTMH